MRRKRQFALKCECIGNKSMHHWPLIRWWLCSNICNRMSIISYVTADYINSHTWIWLLEKQWIRMTGIVLYDMSITRTSISRVPGTLNSQLSCTSIPNTFVWTNGQTYRKLVRLWLLLTLVLAHHTDCNTWLPVSNQSRSWLTGSLPLYLVCSFHTRNLRTLQTEHYYQVFFYLLLSRCVCVWLILCALTMVLTLGKQMMDCTVGGHGIL
jgi:hypothetical protein